MRMKTRMMGWVVVGMVAMGVGERAQAQEPAEHRRDADATVKLPFTVSKETTRITSPLREDGTPDYVGAMNEKYGKGLKPEENAFVGWVEAVGSEKLIAESVRAQMIKLCGSKEESRRAWFGFHQYLKESGADSKTLDGAAGQELQAEQRLWVAEDFPKLAEYLDKNEAYFEGVRVAFARPRYWMPYVSEDGRTMARMRAAALEGQGAFTVDSLTARATMRAKTGDFEGFLSDVVTAERMAKHFSSQGMLMERSCGESYLYIIHKAIGAVAGSGNLTGEQCRKLRDAMELPGVLPSRAEAIDMCARWTLLDGAAMLATGKAGLFKGYLIMSGGFDGREDHEWFAGLEPEQVNWDAVMKGINQEVDSWVAATKKESLPEYGQAMRVIEERIKARRINFDQDIKPRMDESREDYSRRVEARILEVFRPRNWLSEDYLREVRFRWVMTRALVAAAHYKAANGKWPDELSQLVPDYLNEAPRDVYSQGGKENLSFHWSAEGAVVRSAGKSHGQQIEVGVK